MSDPVTFLYESLVLCCIVGFAAYDIYTRRVPDRALVCFSPVALMSPLVRMLSASAGAGIWTALGLSLTGSAAGFLILLSAALISKGGTGLGGGDIKLSAVLGFIYGPYRMLEILLTAALLSAVAALVVSRRRRDKPLSIPFVPFIAAGSLTALINAMF